MVSGKGYFVPAAHSREQSYDTPMTQRLNGILRANQARETSQSEEIRLALSAAFSRFQVDWTRAKSNLASSLLLIVELAAEIAFSPQPWRYTKLTTSATSLHLHTLTYNLTTSSLTIPLSTFVLGVYTK